MKQVILDWRVEDAVECLAELFHHQFVSKHLVNREIGARIAQYGLPFLIAHDHVVFEEDTSKRWLIDVASGKLMLFPNHT